MKEEVEKKKVSWQGRNVPSPPLRRKHNTLRVCMCYEDVTGQVREKEKENSQESGRWQND